MYSISSLVLKTSSLVLLYSILILVFLHLYRKKFENIWISLPLSLLTGLVPILALYKFQIMAWYMEGKIVFDTLITQSNLGIKMIVSTLSVGLFFIFLGNYFSEKLPKQEYRSFYHTAYGLMTVTLIAVSQDLAFFFLSLSLGLFLIAEYLRQSDDTNMFTLYIKKVLNKPLKSYEKRGYIASFSYIGGMLIVTLFLHPLYALAAALILTVGDPAAALVGKKFGRSQFSHNPEKSLEGSLAMLTVSIIALQVIRLPLVLTLFTAFGATVFESLKLKVSDNLMLPLMAGIVMASLG